MAEELGERTEDATPRRIQEARREGQVAKSQDLTGAISLFCGVLVFIVFGSSMTAAMGSFMRRVLSRTTGADPFDETMVSVLLQQAGSTVLGVMWAPMLVLAVVAFFSHFIQVGPLLTTKPLTPKVTKLNPISGTKRLFNRKNLVKSVMSVFKLAAVVTVAWLVLASQMDRLAMLPSLPIWLAVREMARLVFELALWLLLILVVIALADLIFQRWQHKQELKMTKQQIKDERKTMEGDPEMKGRRAKLGRELIMQQINAAVPNADVVVTNPTHFSVAIKYDSDAMRAPKVVAKGGDLLAFRIRQIAARAEVPIVERPPLARALYAGVEVGQEIRPEHYEAVAEVLAYVYRLDEQAAA